MSSGSSFRALFAVAAAMRLHLVEALVFPVIPHLLRKASAEGGAPVCHSREAEERAQEGIEEAHLKGTRLEDAIFVIMIIVI